MWSLIRMPGGRPAGTPAIAVDPPNQDRQNTLLLHKVNGIGSYSEDLRERAVRRAEAGETIREIAAVLRISLSCVSKWRKRQRETGSLAPDQVGGHKPRTLAGEHAEWLRARVAEGPFTTRGLTAELVARGVKTD